MNKKQIKIIAHKMFIQGKNDCPDRQFIEKFEEYWEQMQEDKETGVWN
jgi:hypothetical protein